MDLIVGDYLELEIQEGYYKGEYASRIMSIDNRNLAVSTPRLAGHLVPFREDQTLRISVPKRDARYDFEAKVSLVPGSDVNQLRLTMSEIVHRQQRRSDFRIAVNIPIELLYFYRQGVPVASLTVSSIDLSAGGTKVETPEEFPPHLKLKLALILPDEEINTNAVVTRSGVIGIRQPGCTLPYWTSLKFFNISDNQKKKILKFIYKQQELRVKGLI